MSVASLSTGEDLHSFRNLNNATAHVRDTVDRHPAFETDTHTAKRATRLSRNRCAEGIDVRTRHRGGDRSAVLHDNRDFIDC